MPIYTSMNFPAGGPPDMRNTPEYSITDAMKESVVEFLKASLEKYAKERTEHYEQRFHDDMINYIIHLTKNLSKNMHVEFSNNNDEVIIQIALKNTFKYKGE